MAIRSITTRGLLMLLLLVSGTRGALAFSGASDLTYSVPSGVLSGYSATWKDVGDINSASICTQWVRDELGFDHCVRYLYLEYFVGTIGRLYNPGFSLHSEGSNVGWAYSEVPYSVNQPAGGVWTANGVHHVLEDIYDCFYDAQFGWSCWYAGTNVYHLGDTQQQLGIAQCSTATTNQAAIGLSLSWPAREPYERAATMFCVGPDVVTFGYYNDSFGLHYSDLTPTNDPCATKTVPTDANSAGVHSHPYFQTATEYRRGLGCHGSQASPSPAELAALNQQNRDFSSGDIAEFRCRAAALFVRSPQADQVRRLQGRPGSGNCPYTNTRVYP